METICTPRVGLGQSLSNRTQGRCYSKYPRHFLQPEIDQRILSKVADLSNQKRQHHSLSVETTEATGSG
jgi:hypothetical protein